MAVSTLDNLFQSKPKEELKNGIDEFKKMKQLGFDTVKDYMEFLEYQQSKHI